MKSAAVLAILFLSSLLQQPPQLIRILEVIRQEWTEGVDESIKGVNYEIRLVANRGSAKLNFVSITVDKQECAYKISNISHPSMADRFHKGDTLLLSALLKNPPVYPPQKEKLYPVIAYRYRKVLYYFPIRQGIQVSQENYP
jgi:hypothetical protein